MKITRRHVEVTSFFLLLSMLAILVLTHPKVKPRSTVIIAKLLGQTPEKTWPNIWHELLPHNTSTAITKAAGAGANPYRLTVNPHNTTTDATAGKLIFQSQCAGCHGSMGKGGTGPDLSTGAFRHGASDLAIYNTISNGVASTAMQGTKLPPNSIWQVVTFIRSLQEAHNKLATIKTNNTHLISAPSVSYEQLINATQQPEKWLMYSGSYNSHRHSSLNQINRNNTKDLTLNWVYQFETNSQMVQTTPLVVGNTMYLTEPPNNVIALDTQTGLPIWDYKRNLPEKLTLCCFQTNRGVALLGNLLYLGTLDGHLVALDARNGNVKWDIEVADYRAGYSITSAPLVVKDKIIIGTAGGEFGIRGFLDAYNAKTGKREWRTYTVPGPDEPGHESWSGDSWKTGGAPTWMTGSFDPELNLIYWGTGNPNPNFAGAARIGDNLYSDSVLALNADTGKLQWHYQFTPHDEHDWDANQIPVLVDIVYENKLRKLLLAANRNGFFYALDRETGEFLRATAFAKQTWLESFNPQGKPTILAESTPTPQGTLTSPGPMGGTNWWSPSYSPVTKLFYVPSIDGTGLYFNQSITAISDRTPGKQFKGSVATFGTGNLGPGNASIRAIAPQTGAIKWEYPLVATSSFRMAGVLSTAGQLVFTVDAQGKFLALDAESGKKIWHANLGSSSVAAPITYMNDNKQFLAIVAGRAIFTFSLGE
ncbi:MAG: alcohol dehydrogenase (cytochrome c) [Methyloprofundus sp.]|nr:MAG: alcohol dehydrogenase (cytochrome c) [Methyloprofundus sp.]